MEEEILTKLRLLSIQYHWDEIFHQNKIIYLENEEDEVIFVDQSSSIDLTTQITPPSTPKSKSITPIKAPKSIGPFSRCRESLTISYYKEFNQLAFNDKLPDDLPIIWNKRMTKTAGFTKMRKYNLSDTPRTASIELSTKVVDNEERLRQTLAHEMCHVAAWLLDGINAPPHGNHFWKWAHQIEKAIPTIKITQCHSYEINVPFKFACTNEQCQHIYSRHSKKGIDVRRQVCGLCQSPLEFAGAYNSDGTPKKVKEASGFSLYVQQNYQQVKLQYNLSQHKEIMVQLSQLYQENRDNLQNIPSRELFTDNHDVDEFHDAYGEERII